MTRVLPSAAVLAVIVGGGIGLGVVFALLLGTRVQQADAADETAASAAAVSCDEGRQLRVLTGPEMTDALETLGARFRESLEASGRPCVDVTVAGAPPAEATDRLVSGWDVEEFGEPPDVWIPDSSTWVQLARSRADDPALFPESSPVVARSPIVVALPQPMAEALTVPTAKWRDLLELADAEEGWAERRHPEWGAFRFVVADPMDTTTGMLTVLSLGLAQDEIWAGGLSDDSAITIDSDLGVLRFRRVVADVADDVGTQLRRYVEASEPMEVMSALPLTERQLWRFNRGDLPLPPADQSTDSDAPAVAMDGPPPTPLQAVYPTEGTVAADYPFVTLRGPWLDGSAATAAAEFAEFLTSDAGRSVLLEQGFRGPQNRPNPNFELGQGLTPSLGGDYAPVPDAETTRSVRQSWRNVTRPSSTLMLVDVSGSMLQDIGDGETTRLDATVEAAVRSLDVLPVTSDVGLWEFSTGLEDGRNEGDYRELVDVGPLDGRVDDQRRKTAVVDALRGLEPQNDTALNDTLLAAYTTMRDEYDPDRRSTIVLLTDGRNDDDGSLTHEQLLDQLSAERDDERRVRLVAIAYGDGADIANLEEVTEVTGGKVLASPNADDLDELFLEALSGS